jgi:penicillin-binding protein 2
VFRYGGREFRNAQDAVFGTLALPRALQVSSDVFFYQLGAAANERGPVIQEWARKLGFDEPTGIDLPGEYGGLVPDSKWRNSEFEKYVKCAKKAKVEIGTTAALYECGGIERGWSGGDNVNLAVGQGDLQATPLQMATAYSTIINGGRVPRPHLGQRVEDGNGVMLEEIRVPARRRVSFDQTHQDAIMAGLHGAATAANGTSSDVFADFPYRDMLYGKTGTAERQPNPDQSWYVCYVAHPTKPIVVVTTIERGGFGAETAAPAARLILNEWFDLRSDEFKAGSDQSN